MRQVAVAALLAILPGTAFSQTPWETYLEMPTPENAALVDSASYTPPASYGEKIEGDLLLLEVQVISADREAVRLAFRLMSQIQWGHPAEMLDIILGRLIRIDPHMFLEELNAIRAKVQRLGHLLGNFGYPYVDRLEAHNYEVTCRIAALKSVEDPQLREIQSECIHELEEMYYPRIHPGSNTPLNLTRSARRLAARRYADFAGPG